MVPERLSSRRRRSTTWEGAPCHGMHRMSLDVPLTSHMPAVVSRAAVAGATYKTFDIIKQGVRGELGDRRTVDLCPAASFHCARSHRVHLCCSDLVRRTATHQSRARKSTVSFNLIDSGVCHDLSHSAESTFMPNAPPRGTTSFAKRSVTRALSRGHALTADRSSSWWIE